MQVQEIGEITDMRKISEGSAMRYLIDNDSYFMGVESKKPRTQDELGVFIEEYQRGFIDGDLLNWRKVEQFGAHHVIFGGGSRLDFKGCKCYLYDYGMNKVIAVEHETDSDTYGKIIKTMYYLIEEQ